MANPHSVSSLFDAVTPSGGSIHRIFRGFGASEKLASDAQVLLAPVLRVLVVLLVAFAITRLVPRLARRLVRGLQLRGPIKPRASGRATTIAAVLASVFRGVVWVVAFLTVLGIFGINLAPFVATATVVGAAVGFGAQSLVRDFLSGLLILAEDQYGVGDSITVGDTTGTVEGLNLRTTKVRALDGVVWFIANGEVRTVGNSSEGYNQALVDLVVPPGTDLTRAGQAIEHEVVAAAADPSLRDDLIEPPVYWGVQSVAADGITLRVVAKTAPGASFRVARALRGRLLERLRAEGVAWATSAAAPAGDSAATKDGS
jgi:small conductance mechanosensitive channel